MNITLRTLIAAAGVAIGMAWSGLLSNFAAGAFRRRGLPLSGGARGGAARRSGPGGPRPRRTRAAPCGAGAPGHQDRAPLRWNRSPGR